MREITYLEAIREALREEMRRDERVFIMGEDIAVYGGARGVTKGLLEEFGEERVRDTPLSETAIIGAGVGAALTGMRPICELQLFDFAGVCFDEIYNKAGKWRYMHGGEMKVPMVIRGPVGAMSGGAEHSQCPEALFLHGPGLKLVLPSTPYDAKGLLKAAIRDDNPVLYFEHKRLYGMKGPVPEEEYIIPLGQADIKREGGDVTIIALSYMVHRALEAAANLAQEGIEAEVVDPRTLVPFDKEIVFQSVRKTGRVVIVHEANKRGGAGAEIAALIAEEIFDALRAPIKRVASPDVPIPFSPALERLYLPDVDRITKAVREVLTWGASG